MSSVYLIVFRSCARTTKKPVVDVHWLRIQCLIHYGNTRLSYDYKGSELHSICDLIRVRDDKRA